MFGNNRDPVDEFLQWLMGFLIGMVAAMGFSWLMGNRDKEKVKQKDIVYPSSLEVDYRQGITHVKPHKFFSRWRIILLGSYVVFAFFSALSGNGFLNSFGWGVTVVCCAYVAFRYFKDELVREQGRIFERACQVPSLNLATAHRYTVCLPRNHKWQADQAGRFMANILKKVGGKLVFQIVADHETVSWHILDLRQQVNPDIVRQAIRAFYPDADVTVGKLDETEFEQSFYRYTMPFGFTHMPLAPMRFVETLKTFDPLTTLTADMGALQTEERITYSVFVTEQAEFLYAQSENFLKNVEGLDLTQLFTASGRNTLAYNAAREVEPVTDRFNANDQAALEAKINAHVCHQALVMIQIDAPSRERVESLSVLHTHLAPLAEPNYNSLYWQDEHFPASIQHITNVERTQNTQLLQVFERWLTNREDRWQAYRLILNTSELAALWHLPHQDFASNRIEWIEPELGTLPNELLHTSTGLHLGEGYVNRVAHPVHMLAKDRATHTLVTGKIGMGKSTFLHHLIRQDIEAGCGVAVIDPKGNLIADILRASIPDERMQDVVLWDLADFDHPPSLNFLLQSENTAREDTAASIMNVFEKVYGKDFAYTRMGQILVQSLQAVMGDTTPTLRDISRLFRDPAYQDELLRNIDNPVAEEFWMRFDNKSESARNQEVSPVLNKVEAVYGDKLLYPIFCQPNTLQLREWMEQKKIILISLNAPNNHNLSRDKQSLLGSILLSEFQLAVATQDLADPFYLYADEAHQLVASSLDEIFIKARQRQLSMTLATQYPKQLDQAYDAVMETVGATVVLPCNQGTATILHKQMKPEFSDNDLIDLQPYTAAVRMRHADKQLRPFLLHTIDIDIPQGQAVEERVQMIRAQSRQNYFPMSREDIYAWLEERYSLGRKQQRSQMNGTENNLYDDFSESIPR